MRRARMIVNPLAFERRAAGRLPEVVAALEDGGLRLDVTFTRQGRRSTELAQEAVADGYDLVVVAGGDGTVSEVAAGLLGTRVPLGILPVGAFNNIARGLGISPTRPEAIGSLLSGMARPMDVGMANGTPFFEAAGVGLDASLLPIGENIKSGRYERLLEAGVTFLRQTPAEVLITMDGEERTARTPLVVVANGPYYGAGFTSVPGALSRDGVLEVAIFECGLVSMAKQFALSAQNRQHREACVSMYHARDVAVVPSLPLPAHADGKSLGNVPLTCEVLQDALLVIGP